MMNRTFYMSDYTRTEEVTLSIILGIIIAVSLFGNFGMIIVLLKNDKMWNSTNMLIGNLALSGVLVTAFCMPFSCISIINGEWPFKEGGACKFIAFNTSALLLSTIWTHTMISVDKYFYVVKPFSRTMTVSRAWLIICSIWIQSFLMSVLPLFKFGQFAYNHTTLVCGVGFPKKSYDTVYLASLATVSFIIPIAIMIYVYGHVFYAIRQHRARMKASTFCSLDVLKLQKKLVLTVVFSLICFIVCWSPFFLFVTMAVRVKTIKHMPRGLGIAAYWCSYSYNALNPLIICSMSRRFGDGVKELIISIFKVVERIFVLLSGICCLCFRKHSVKLKQDIQKQPVNDVIIISEFINKGFLMEQIE